MPNLNELEKVIGEEVTERADIVPLSAKDREAQRMEIFQRFRDNETKPSVEGDTATDIIGSILAERMDTRERKEIVFANGAQLDGAIDAYFVHCFELAQSGTRVYPDVEGLAAYIGVTRQQLLLWKKGELGEDIQRSVESAMNQIAAAKNQLAMNGKMAPLVWTVMMNNNHGYVQQNKLEMDINIRRQPADVSELINNAKMLP